MPFPFNIGYGGDALAQPSPLLNQFAAMAERRREQNQRLSQAGRVSKSFLKLVSEQTGMDAGEIDNLSSEEATARHLGLIGQQSYKKGAEDLLDALALREQREAETDNQRRLARAYQEFAESGEPGRVTLDKAGPEIAPAPLNTEELGVRSILTPHTAAQTPQRFLEALARQGAVPGRNEIHLLQALQTRPARGLPLGEKRVVDEETTIVGTGLDFEPNVITKTKKPAPPLYPWSFSEDTDEWQQGLLSIKDPVEAAAVVAARSAYEIARGRPSVMEKLIGDTLKPGGGESRGDEPRQGAPKAPPPEKRKKGTVYLTPLGNLKWTGTGWVVP